jgi:hypothetical protein
MLAGLYSAPMLQSELNPAHATPISARLCARTERLSAAQSLTRAAELACMRGETPRWGALFARYRAGLGCTRIRVVALAAVGALLRVGRARFRAQENSGFVRAGTLARGRVRNFPYAPYQYLPHPGNIGGRSVPRVPEREFLRLSLCPIRARPARFRHFCVPASVPLKRVSIGTPAILRRSHARGPP